MLAILLALLGPGCAKAGPGKPDVDARIEQLVASVSSERLETTLKQLESFGTRNTLSSVNLPDRGIGAARQWIFNELQKTSPKLHVSFDTYQIARQTRVPRDVEIRNVMAVLAGRSARRVYVSAHYDTVAIEGGQSTTNARGVSGGALAPVAQPADPDAPNDFLAPGVNDDGSGVALTLELARLFSQSPSSSTRRSSSCSMSPKSRDCTGRFCTRSGRRPITWRSSPC